MKRLPMIIIVVLWATLRPCLAHAWSEHHLITKAALRDVPNVVAASVTVTPFDSLLKKLGYANALQFNEALQIHKDYIFAFRAHEAPGQQAPLLQVLSIYSDEPDWGMDQNLFTPDQYPALWKSEYAYMGSDLPNTPSQGFRHMYWGPLKLAHPLNTFKLPLTKLFGSLGVAQERAAIFVDLSRKAKAAGEAYWSARFLANALHYIEDVSQPFHASQTPTKRFILMPLVKHEGDGFHGFVHQVAHIVEYYHIAFEDYVGRIMKEENQNPAALQSGSFGEALSTSLSEDKTLDYHDSDAAKMVQNMSAMSSGLAGKTGRACVDFFPPITKPYLDLDVPAYENDAWWTDVLERGRSDSEAKQAYFSVVRTIFEKLGYSIRQVVAKEIKTDTGYENE